MPTAQLPTNHDRGGSASKKPVDAAGAAAAMDGSSKSPTQDAAHSRLDACGAHSPLENQQTAAGFPQRQQAPHPGSTNGGKHENDPLAPGGESR